MRHNLWVLLVITLFVCVSGPLARGDILDHWTANQVSTNYFGLDCVVYANNRYVAYGEYLDNGVIMTSEDGKTWTRCTNGLNSGFSYSIALVYTGNRFFALGGFGESAVSTDGTNWTTFIHSQVGLLSGAAYGNSRYVAVGSSPFVGSGIISSSDSTTWSFRTNLVVSDVAFGGGRFVAITENTGLIYTSLSGTTWAQLPISGGSKISYCNGIFIVPLASGTNLLSPDGINWSLVATGIGTKLNKVVYSNGLFMASAGSSLATSNDGTNWIIYPTMPGSYSGYFGDNFYVATDGTRLVTVGKVLSSSPSYYNGFTYYSDVLADLRMTNATPPQIALSGLVGWLYQIQSTDGLMLGTNAWKTNLTLSLPSTPYVWTDAVATNSQRFYRAVLLP